MKNSKTAQVPTPARSSKNPKMAQRRNGKGSAEGEAGLGAPALIPVRFFRSANRFLSFIRFPTSKKRGPGVFIRTLLGKKPLNHARPVSATDADRCPRPPLPG